jgi:hypothetical protein
MTDTTLVKLTVTLTDSNGSVYTVVDSDLYYIYAKSAILTALDQINQDVANNLRLKFEQQNAAIIEAAQAPIEAAQATALTVFSGMEA